MYDENDEPIIASRPAVAVPVDIYHILYCLRCRGRHHPVLTLQDSTVLRSQVSATRLEGAQERLPEGLRHEAHIGDLIRSQRRVWGGGGGRCPKEKRRKRLLTLVLT